MPRPLRTTLPWLRTRPPVKVLPVPERVVVLFAKKAVPGASELLRTRRTGPVPLSTTLALIVSWRPVALDAV